METCKSPRTVMNRAYQLGRQLWGGFASPFSRHDFTLAQLFACLVLRELLKLSYRKAEAFLRDCDWLVDIKLAATPDHNTLWRAFGLLCSTRKVNRALDLLVRDACEQDLLGVPKGPATIDSTCYEPHHRSDHYDRVCRKIGREKKSGVYAQKVAAAANLARSEKAKRMPKLAIAVDAGSHLILSAVARIGTGSDAPDFCPLLQRAWQRCDVRTVVADAGYDSEQNHRAAQLDMTVASIIPAKIGRPSDKPPAGKYRRRMKERFACGTDKKAYGQRAQSETVNSMMKRNLGDCLRSIRPDRQKQEMLLRALVHNLMILANYPSQ